MTAAIPPAIASARDRADGYLRARAGSDAERLRVTLLGLGDLLWREPVADWQRELVETDLSDQLPVYLHDGAALLGPVGYDRPCHLCLVRRWQQLRNSEERDAVEAGGAVGAAHGSPFLTCFAFEAVWQLLRRLTTEQWPVNRHGHPYVYRLGLAELTVTRHPLVPDSQCPRCSRPTPDSAEDARITLYSRRKRAVDEFRTNAATDYQLDLDAYVNPVCGVAGSAAYPRMISTTTANARGHLGVRGGGFLHETFWGGHSDSYAHSALLGIMEAHERLAGTQPRKRTGFVRDSYRNLGDRALDPKLCWTYTDDFYARTQHYLPYHDDLVVPWAWGHSLRDDRQLLVPAAIAYYHLYDQRNKFVQECSNGCASGGNLEEAIHYGLLELIERDAFLISWFAKAALPEFDPHSCASLRTRLMVDRLAMYGYDVRLFDARIELPVPVVIAVAQRRDGGMGTVLFGAAASLDPEEAIASSLYEIASEVPTFAEDTELKAGELREKAADFDKILTLSDHAPLFGMPEMLRYTEHLLGHRPATLPPAAEVYRDWRRARPHTLDLRDDVQFCVDAVTAIGSDVIVVDQTSPEQDELGLRTVSVIAPGLLPIDFGWGRQRALHLDRTRTVLRRVGLRDTDLDPAELNWAPHPFP